MVNDNLLSLFCSKRSNLYNTGQVSAEIDQRDAIAVFEDSFWLYLFMQPDRHALHRNDLRRHFAGVLGSRNKRIRGDSVFQPGIVYFTIEKSGMAARSFGCYFERSIGWDDLLTAICKGNMKFCQKRTFFAIAVFHIAESQPAGIPSVGKLGCQYKAAFPERREVTSYSWYCSRWLYSVYPGAK